MTSLRFPVVFSVLVIALQYDLHPGKASSLRIINKCDYRVWPVIQNVDNWIYGITGFSLQKGESKTMDVETGWWGNVWGRTRCSVDQSTGKFACETGNCHESERMDCQFDKESALHNQSLIKPVSVTLAEFKFQYNGIWEDFYYVTIENGFNIPMEVTPQGGSGPNCSVASCAVDLNGMCPDQLSVLSSSSESRTVVACSSACVALGTPQYCCSSSSTTCPMSNYALFFARNCPRAYSYPYDEFDGTYLCFGSRGYTITFCPSTPSGKKKLVKVLAISIGILVTILMLIGATCCYNVKEKAKKKNAAIFERAEGDDYSTESLQCGLSVLQAATKNFSKDNKIGRGGFGVVYKGTLPSGKHIAIKKLLTNSGKGEEEFKNEMKVVAKLQHRNLVGLLAFCLAGEERLLVFEYVPNKSLDYFIFDVERQGQLNWPSRFKIIVGIARGLLYLHEDSRLRIIHRDLKPSNILLDEEMNPKIADFGMARIFERNQGPSSPGRVNQTMQQTSGADQTHQSTSKVGGTLGYIAPEYAQTRRFSIKTDVYSFGVIVLEIISGKRNSRFHQLGLAEDLLSYAWEQWRTGNPFELMDPTLRSSYSDSEVRSCIHLGLLCVQKDPNARPSMANIVHIMLNSSSTNTLPMPQSPASFALDGSDSNSGTVSSHLNWPSVDEDTITVMYPR